ncbi:MAG: FliH/SctL family protein [Smithella sp.]
MDSYKASVIKADEVVNSSKPLSLFRNSSNGKNDNVKLPDSAGSSSASEENRQKKLKAEMEKHLSRVSDESYRKGYSEGVEFQKKEMSSVLDALSAITGMIPLIKKDIMAKTEEQIVKLAFAIAEKVINHEVATNKEVILGVLKGVSKNISVTEGIKIRLNPQDLHYIMEIKKDFLQSIEGVRNAVFEEDVSIKRGGAVVETMLGEVDARLESQLQEIREAMLKL